MRLRWAASVLAAACLLCIAGCAAPRPSVPEASPQQVIAPPPDGIDGRYRGIARLVRANIAGCPRSGSRIVTIEGGALSVNYRAARVSIALAATVSQDGVVHGSDGQGTVAGQISGRHLDLLVSSDYCEVRYALDRV